ncbi:MAG: hypothetical protein AAF349_25165, partial [Cyanobacteria bacterium P01_A01_bin.68]
KIVTGQPLFGLDLKRDGMLIAMIVHPPAFGMKLKIYRKDNQGNCSIQTLGKDDELRLNSIDLTLTMAEIYEDAINII